jgi:hypothetical protein
MNNQQFIEQLCVVGIVMAYTTAFLFLSWAVWQAWVLWLELKIKTSREIYDDKSAKIRAIEYIKVHKEYEDWAANRYGNPNTDPTFYEDKK